MLLLILTWIGIVLALSLLLIMAIGPAIVEADARWHERKHERRRARPRATQDLKPAFSGKYLPGWKVTATFLTGK